MKLTFGHLCDFATQGNNGKLILVGIFENVYVLEGRPKEEVAFPSSFLAFKLECSVAEGSEHEIAVKVVSEDGDEINSVQMGRHDLQPAGPGRPLTVQAIVPVIGLELPKIVDCEFEIHVDGASIGSVPCSVIQASRPSR